MKNKQGGDCSNLKRGDETPMKTNLGQQTNLVSFFPLDIVLISASHFIPNFGEIGAQNP
jgi:hypothetical protein